MVGLSRVEGPYSRTCCDCAECTINCKYMPGYLVPGDIERMFDASKLPNEDVLAWAMRCLLASPGALVVARGQVLRIPTLVPARDATGYCLFLADNRCTIHDVSPFGCAFFDAHQSRAESDARSAHGLAQVLSAHAVKGLYSQLWQALFDAGKVAASPDESRQKLREAWQAASACARTGGESGIKEADVQG